jgi:hypothetical protein
MVRERVVFNVSVMVNAYVRIVTAHGMSTYSYHWAFKVK